MAIWDQLLRKAVRPLVSEQVNEIAKDNIEKGLVSTFNVANSFGLNVSPFSAGDQSKKLFTRSTSYRVLRDFAMYYPILRSCINYRKRQITHLDWDVAPKEVIMDPAKKKEMKARAERVKKFLQYPTGDKNVSFRTFISKVIEDLVVLDAVAIYKRKNRGGGLYGYLPIDAATIELVVNVDGTMPQPPETAFIQKIDGKIVAELTSEELTYRMLNPRTYTPYGLSPVESLIITVTTALKLASFNLGYLTDGNVPEGFVELPKEVATNTDQLLLWQEKWDAMFSGDPRYQRKIKFLPEGMKLHETKKLSDMQFEAFDKWLLQVTCSVMEVPPQGIGFQFDRGKGATESEWEIGKERGQFPMAHFFEEIFTEIIEEDLGEKDLQFVWTNINPTNMKEEADVFKALVGTGAVSVDEWRIAEGYDPIGLGNYIMSPVGPVSVEAYIKSGGMIPTPGVDPNNPTPADQKTPDEKGAPQKPNTNAPQKPNSNPAPGMGNKVTDSAMRRIESMSRGEVIEELKRWKKVVAKDYKQGRGFRDFTTNIVDARTQGIIKEGLKAVSDKEDIDELFDPLISQENQVIAAMMDLYDEISQLTRYEQSAANTSAESN